MGETKDAYKILMVKPDRSVYLNTGKEVEGNIKMDHREIGCEDGRWMELAQVVSSGRLWN